MELFRLIFILVTVFVLADGKPKPTTESTHTILKRLGFDPVQKIGGTMNHHSKRVALEANKARYRNNDLYSSNSDSRMFVVKLPPHSPYYSHVKPEKFKNDAAAVAGATSLPSKPASFQTNGKPHQIYHWNIPVLRKLTQEKKTTVRNANEDSKVYRIKILPSGHVSPKNSNAGEGQQKKEKPKNKQSLQQTGQTIKIFKNYKNKLYRFSDFKNGNSLDHGINVNRRNNSAQIDLLRSKIPNGTDSKRRVVTPYGSSFGLATNKKSNEKHKNEVSKIKSKTNLEPNYYVPAIPQQNSFYKYFTGNGKLKSFYVIEKSKKQTRRHRLL